MKDKLEVLENLFEETGSILRRDVDRCKSLYGEFVRQILDASELLSLDVIQGKLEIPKFGWLEESLQIRNEIEYGIEKPTPKRLHGEEKPNTIPKDETVRTILSAGPAITSHDDIGSEEDSILLMSNKCIQTTPLQRERTSLGRKNLLKFLQKSNVLKNGDTVYFTGDKSYDADVSQAVNDLTTTNSSFTYDDCTLYPNSSYDAPSSAGDTLPSSLSGMSNELHNETVSSSTDGSPYVGTPGFKRVRAKRESMVSFLLPMKDNNGVAVEARQSELGVCDHSKASEASAYQSISLIACNDSSLDSTSVPDASAALHKSIEEHLELSQEIAHENLSLQNEVFEIESGLNVVPAEKSNVALPSTESIEEEQAEKGSKKLTVIKEQDETQELVTEASNCQDVVFNKETMELCNDEIRCDQLYDASVLQRADTIVPESISPDLHREEMKTVQAMQQEQIISSDEMYNEMGSVHDYELTGNATKFQGEATHIADDDPTKVKIKRKRRRRRPPLVMPKNYRPPRRDFISLFNETRTRTSKSLLYQSSFFRKEPLSAGLKQYKESKSYKSVLKEAPLVKKNDRISKQRPPMCYSNGDDVSGENGFEVIQKIVWTPQSANIQVGANKESSLVVIDNAERNIVRDQSATPRSDYSTEKSQDEMFMSIRAKPKRTQKEDSCTVDLKLEITLQNGDKNCLGRRKANSKKGRDAVLREKGAERHGNGLAEEKQDAKEISSDTTVFSDFKSQFSNASKSGNKEESGDGSMVYNSALKKPRKKRVCPAGQEGSRGDLNRTGTGRGAKAKRKIPSNKSISEVTLSIGDADEDHLVFDKQDGIKYQTEELTLAKRGKRVLRSCDSSTRVTRDSQNVVRDSTMKVKQTKSLNLPGKARKKSMKIMECEETKFKRKGGNSRREELNESGKRTTNGFKKCGKIPVRQRTDSRGKGDSNAQNQESVSDTNRDGDISKDGVQVNINNKSILSSKPSRVRKTPKFYGIEDSNLADLSATQRKSAGRSESKSRKNLRKKPNSKMPTRSMDNSKVSTVEITEASGTFIDMKEEGPIAKKPRGKWKAVASNINDEFKPFCEEECDENVGLNRKDVNCARIGESITKDGVANYQLTDANSKATKNRYTRVSAVPSLVIINENQEDSSVFPSPNENEGECLIGNDLAPEKDGHKDLKKMKESGEKSLSVRQKRRKKRRNDSKVTKKCVRKHPPGADDIEDAACNNSFVLAGDMNVNGLIDMNEERKNDIKENDSKGDATSIIEEGAPTIKETGCKEDTEALSCASKLSDFEVAGTLNDSVGGGEGNTHAVNRRAGRRAKPGDKSANTRNDKRIGARRKKAVKSVDEEIGVDTAIARGHEEKERIEGDVSNDLGQESNEGSGKSMRKTVKENVQLSSLETPDLRRSTRKKQDRNTAIEKENEFIAPKAMKKNSVESKPPVSKRSVDPGKENAIPEKRRRPLFNKKNTSLMSLNFSVIQDTMSMNGTQNTTMNTNSIVIPQTLSNFLRSFVAPKVKKNAS